MSATLAKSAFTNLAQNAEMHQLRLAIFGITGLNGSGADKIPYATLFPDWNTGSNEYFPETTGPIAVMVNPWSPDGSTAVAAMCLDSTNGGAGSNLLGWDNFTTAGTGNVYVICPSGVTTCELVILY
jgi:hypothetical protein